MNSATIQALSEAARDERTMEGSIPRASRMLYGNAERQCNKSDELQPLTEFVEAKCLGDARLTEVHTHHSDFALTPNGLTAPEQHVAASTSA